MRELGRYESVIQVLQRIESRSSVGWLVGRFFGRNAHRRGSEERALSVCSCPKREGRLGLERQRWQAFKERVSSKSLVTGTEIDIAHRGQELEEVEENSSP
jgi:hypothetical protein